MSQEEKISKLKKWGKWGIKIIYTLTGIATLGISIYLFFLIEQDITGKITDMNDNPINNAKVIIKHKTKSIPQLIEYSNTKGYFSFSKVKRGKYFIAVEHEDYLTFKDGTESGMVDKQFKLKNFYFDLAITLRDNQTNTPIDNAIVTINNQSVQSDINGKALFKGLLKDSYTISVIKNNYNQTNINLLKQDILKTDTILVIKMQSINNSSSLPISLVSWDKWGNINVSSDVDGLQISGNVNTAGINTTSVPTNYANRTIVFSISNSNSSRFDQGKLFKFEVNDIAQTPVQINMINFNDGDFINSGDGDISYRLPQNVKKMQLVFYNCTLNNLRLSAQLQ